MQQIIDAFSDPLRWTPIATLFLFLLWETTAPFFQFFKNANRERAFHLGRNITLGLINSILVTILFTALWVRTGFIRTRETKSFSSSSQPRRPLKKR